MKQPTYSELKQRVLQYVSSHHIHIEKKEDVVGAIYATGIPVKPGQALYAYLLSGLLAHFGFRKRPKPDENMSEREHLLSNLYSRGRRGDVAAAKLWLEITKEEQKEEEIPKEVITEAKTLAQKKIQEWENVLCEECRKKVHPHLEKFLHEIGQ